MTIGKPSLLRTLSTIVPRLSLSLALALLPAIAAESLDDTKVGETGDPDNLVFEGLQSFTDRQIRQALLVTPSYLLASHPQAELKPLLDELRQKIQAGYQAAGFPDAAVKAAFNSKSNRAHVHVTEGPHFEAGKIRVVGAKSISISELKNWFTKSASEEQIGSGLNTPGKASRPEDAIWETGAPANFSATWLTQAIAQVEACLADQGFFFVKANVELQRNSPAGTADLIITIQDEGPVGVIDQIKVTGMRVHSAEDIIQFLRLQSGQRLTTTRLAEVRQKLQNCGRFWYYTVTPEFDQKGENVSSRHVNVLVAVKELEGVPHLNKPLSKTQQALVRLCEWLERFPSRNEDLEFKVSSTNRIPLNLRIVISPKHGFLINSSDLQGTSPISAGLEVSDRALQLAAWATGVKLASEYDNNGRCFLHFLPSNDESTTNRFNLSFGAGFSNRDEPAATPQKSPLAIDIQIARACLFGLVSRKDYSYRLESSELVATGEGFALRSDAQTGRLIIIDGHEDGISYQVRSGTRIWNKASGDFERRAAPLTNIYSTGRGFTAFLGLAASEAARWKLTTAMSTNVSLKGRDKAVSALRKLLDPQLLAVEENRLSNDTTNNFHIPLDAMDRTLVQDEVMAFATRYLFAASRELFPKHSWPCTVARETAFVLMNQGRYTSAELERLCESEETGPIGFLVIAHLLAEADPKTAKTIALQGLTRMSAQDFGRDCNLLLLGASGLARSFARLTQTLRTLPESELAPLINVLPENEATLLRESAAALRAQPNAPLDSALSPAILKYWEQSLRADVRTALLDLTKPKTQDAE